MSPPRRTSATSEEQEIGLIAVDSIYSPVTRVRYATEDARVGQKTDYDRLILLGAINLAYFVYALAGWIYARRLPLVVLLALFAILRSAFLGTLENPEPRYTLEMYPVVIVLAAFALGKMCSDQKAGGG